MLHRGGDGIKKWARDRMFCAVNAFTTIRLIYSEYVLNTQMAEYIHQPDNMKTIVMSGGGGGFLHI